MKLFPKIEDLTETVGPRNIIDDIMTLPLIIQRIYGHHILNPNWTFKKVILYQIFSASLIIYVVFGTKEFLAHTTDIKTIAEASYTFAIMTISIIKYLLFAGKRFMFRKLYIKAKTSALDIIIEGSHEKMFELLNKIKNIMFLMFTMITMPVVVYLLRVICFYAKGERVTLSKTTSTLLPMTSPYHEITTIMHTIFMFEMASNFVVVDMWFIFLLYLYCMASDCVVNILNVKKEEGEDENNYAIRLNDRLRKFYLRHLKLVEYLQMLNQTFKWQALIPLVSIIVLSCVYMLSMTKELDLAFATNVMPMIAEIFVYNWFGEQIKTKCNDLREAVIQFDWVNLQLTDKKRYCVIMGFMNKNVGVSTALGSELSLITMTSVLKASYQAITMLQSFDN